MHVSVSDAPSISHFISAPHGVLMGTIQKLVFQVCAQNEIEIVGDEWPEVSRAFEWSAAFLTSQCVCPYS